MSRAVERARDLLVRSGAWLSAEHGVYALRLGADRRGRVSLTLAEPEFRALIDAEGRMIRHAANLGESPIAWLARRRDAAGRPWLTPAEAAAGERLRTEVEQARACPSLTMRWDALPRAGAGSAARIEPGDRALSAGRRVEEALTAVGPRLRPMLTRICVHGDSLKLAETGLGLRRRQGKTLLKQALQALADHYGIG